MEKLAMSALNRLSVEEFRNSDKLPLVLVLDDIRSGLNVGSVFRTADAFAVEKIMLCGITSRPPHREILKTALGSTETVLWEYMDSASEAVCRLKEAGFEVLAVEQTTDSIMLPDFTLSKDKKYAFVLGNEVEGVSEEVLGHCSGALEIPQFGTKHSLNVSVAAGIVVWDFVRKIQAYGLRKTDIC
jgi:tRNA G18 (ribose-2'-O)-methylase SpoU